MNEDVFISVKQKLLKLDSNNIDDYTNYFYNSCEGTTDIESSDELNILKKIIDKLFDIDIGYGKYSCPTQGSMTGFLDRIVNLKLDDVEFPTDYTTLFIVNHNIQKLDTFRVPDTVTTIGYCRIPVDKIIIPTTVTFLDTACFSNAHIIYEGSYSQWQELVQNNNKFGVDSTYYLELASSIKLTTTDKECEIHDGDGGGLFSGLIKGV